MRLTRRGRRLLWALLVIVILAITWATRDLCYTGDGYGSCIEWIEGIQ